MLLIISFILLVQPVYAEISERDLLTLEGTYEFSVTVENPDHANIAKQQDYQYSESLPADLINHTFRVDVKSVDGEFLLYHKGELIDNSGLATNQEIFFFRFYHRVTTSSISNIGYEIKAEAHYDESFQSFDTLIPQNAQLIVFSSIDGEAGYGYIGNCSLEMKKVGGAPEEEPPEETEASRSQLPRALTFVRGRVSIKRADSEEWIWARKGMSLNAGDSIRTGEKGYAEIGMNATEFSITGSEIRMAPQSVITIPDDTLVVEKKSRIRVAIDEGVREIYNLFGEEEFEVETPSAVMGIRGTDFIIEVDDGGNTTVLMNDGTVDLVSRYDGGERNLFAGEKATAGVTAAIGNKEQMTDDDWAAFEDFDFENLPPEEDDETTSAESDAHTQDDTEDDRPRSGTVVWIVVAVGMILAAGLLFVTSRKKQ